MSARGENCVKFVPVNKRWFSYFLNFFIGQVPH